MEKNLNQINELELKKREINKIYKAICSFIGDSSEYCEYNDVPKTKEEVKIEYEQIFKKN
ncbi:MAG: hypothetical protein ABH971_02785 [bacterium]